MKKSIIIILFSFLIFGCNNEKLNKNDMQQLLHEMSNDMNKLCPMVIDKNTTLINVVTLSDKTIQYNYQFDFYLKEEGIEDVKKEMYTNLLNQISTEPKMKIFRDNDVIMRYNYKDKDSKFVFVVVINPKDYHSINNSIPKD